MPCGTAKKIKINKINTYSRPPSLFFLLWAVPRTPESSVKKETKAMVVRRLGWEQKAPCCQAEAGEWLQPPLCCKQ